MILADGASYLKIPMLGDKWIKMPAKDLGLTMTDPTKGLETLRRLPT
ncbi:MAG: hypothetical protein U0R64_01715 [Candidatus Nanopelagicales bacterium]